MLEIVNLATRYGKLPHEVIFADRAGWDDGACFAFNAAATRYIEEFERMASATEDKVYRPPKRPKPTRKVPKHTQEELFSYLGIDPAWAKAKELLRDAVTPEMWATFDEGEWEADSD